jgi:hypothetical protein
MRLILHTGAYWLLIDLRAAILCATPFSTNPGPPE